MCCSNNDVQIKELERSWKAMIMIAHDFFHRWRLVVEKAYGPEAARQLTNQFWDDVGRGTAEAYLAKDRTGNDLEAVVKAFARASEVMGEKVRVDVINGNPALIHEGCPWIDSFRNYGAEGQCQEGCDVWFETAVRSISPGFEVRTESCLANGQNSCVRTFSRKG